MWKIFISYNYTSGTFAQEEAIRPTAPTLVSITHPHASDIQVCWLSISQQWKQLCNNSTIRCCRDAEGRWPSAVCRKGVGSNSILCKSCNFWVHKRCSGIRGRLQEVPDFKSAVCEGKRGSTKIIWYQWRHNSHIAFLTTLSGAFPKEEFPPPYGCQAMEIVHALSF